MADVKVTNRPVEREVVRETVPDNSGGTMTILVVLVIAVLAVAAFFYFNQTRSSPATAVSNSVEQVGDAAGNTAGKVEKSLTIKTE